MNIIATIAADSTEYGISRANAYTNEDGERVQNFSAYHLKSGAQFCGIQVINGKGYATQTCDTGRRLAALACKFA